MINMYLDSNIKKYIVEANFSDNHIILEAMEGNLCDIQRLDYSDIIIILRMIAKIILNLFLIGLNYCDLKDENILYGYNNGIIYFKLTDFGMNIHDENDVFSYTFISPNQLLRKNKR